MLACGGSVSSDAKNVKPHEETHDPFAVEGDHAWETVEEEPERVSRASGAPESRVSSTSEAPSNAPKTTSTNEAPSASASTVNGNSTAASTPALLGARHDVSVTPGTPARCRCLAVALGPATSAELSWSGARPTIDPNTQLVIALGSEGISCEESAPLASYRGYSREGEDVVILVEAAKPGRPVTHGAIIPKPGSKGQVWIQGTGKIPYGKSVDGQARCAL